MIKEQPTDPWGFIASQLPEEVLKKALDTQSEETRPIPSKPLASTPAASFAASTTAASTQPEETRPVPQPNTYPQQRARMAESLRRAVHLV